MNCIIGGRGSGKSTIIDYLRFVFNNEPVDPELKNKFRKRLVDLIRENTEVYVLLEDTENNIWLYMRKFQHSEETHGNNIEFTITSPQTSIYQVIINEKRIIKFEKDLSKFTIEFYGQGEVQSIT
ncbi:MAG: AAA family ATPase, partial [Anaerolineaceae bacterium]|nr:AAA family ATPase [Anaerolineaceae bacterium]